MTAPVNVRLQTPTANIPNWNQEATAWMKLNAEVGGNPHFYSLTIKAVYVVGVIHGICESVSHLLAHPHAKTITYIPAYGVFASGVEILGRCINGNTNTCGSGIDLTTGFKWLVKSSYDTVPVTYTLITTSSYAYTIEMLAALRHFAAHGQATSKKTPAGTYQFGNIDNEILSEISPCISDGLERYWNQLQHDENLCNSLAGANVIALRPWHVYRSLSLFEKDVSGKSRSITEIFNRFDWRV